MAAYLGFGAADSDGKDEISDEQGCDEVDVDRVGVGVDALNEHEDDECTGEADQRSGQPDVRGNLQRKRICARLLSENKEQEQFKNQ